VAIVLSLATALVYGSSDFLGGLASRRTSTVSVVVWSQAFGLLLLAVVLPVIGGHATGRDLAWGAVCGVAGAFAIGMLYRGLAVGTMGIVSPLSAVLGASIPMIYGLAFRGERPGWLAYAGIAAALLAVVCVSVSERTLEADEPARGARAGLFPPGVREGLLAGVGFGLYFIALAQTRTDAGMYPLLAARVTSIVLLLGGGIVFGGVRAVRVARPALAIVVGCGLLDMGANVLFVLAAHMGMLAIVAVLTSLYPAATVALAAIVLRERLGRIQWIGVALALGGALAIASA
jgi:drug/metabolite transporter (DMT)-like permease